MPKMKRIILWTSCLVFVLGFSFPLKSQGQVDFNKVVGIWDLEVNAGSEYYYLTLELKLFEGKLDGTLSEQSGMFNNSPLANLQYDGEGLSFEVTVPTPPDGAEKLVRSEFKLVNEKLEESMTIVDLGMTAPVTGTQRSN